MNDFLKSKRLYLLFILPFVVMAIAVLGSYFPLKIIESSNVHGLINFSFLNNPEPLWIAVISFFIILGIVYMIFYVSEKYKLLSQTTTLPSLIYVLLISGVIVSFGFNYILISVFLITIALERLQTAINDIRSNRSLFDFACLMMLSVLIYPKLVLLLLWTIGMLFFSGRSTLHDIVSLLLGLVTPVLFVGFYYFWIDSLNLLPDIFIENLLAGDFINTLPIVEIGRLGILFFLLLIAISNMLVKYSLLVVNTRRGLFSILFLLIMLGITFFVIPGDYYDFLYILSLPLAFIYARYFIVSKKIIFSNLMFLLLLFACFLIYLS